MHTHVCVHPPPSCLQGYTLDSGGVPMDQHPSKIAIRFELLSGTYKSLQFLNSTLASGLPNAGAERRQSE